VTQTNASQTEEISATSEALAAQATQLQALVGRFKVERESSPVASAPMDRAPTAALPELAPRFAPAHQALPAR
jgi:methyl-accepting chemotaxis protein